MKRLAIIAGKGHLPLDVAKTATADGYDVLVLPIEGQADADFTSYQANLIRLGSIRKTRSIIMQNGIDQLVMVGKVVWPSIAALRPDFEGATLIGKMITRDFRYLSCFGLLLRLKSTLYKSNQKP